MPGVRVRGFRMPKMPPLFKFPTVPLKKRHLQIADPASADMFEAIHFRHDAPAAIKSALSALTEREQTVVRMRLMGNSTLEDVRPYLGGVSRTRVMEIERKALRKLRSRPCAKLLRPLLDYVDIGSDTRKRTWERGVPEKRKCVGCGKFSEVDVVERCCGPCLRAVTLRDPKVFPISGDKLRNDELAKVEHCFVSPDGVIRLRCEVLEVHGRLVDVVCTITDWREWAKSATIERRSGVYDAKRLKVVYGKDFFRVPAGGATAAGASANSDGQVMERNGHK